MQFPSICHKATVLVYRVLVFNKLGDNAHYNGPLDQSADLQSWNRCAVYRRKLIQVPSHLKTASVSDVALFKSLAFIIAAKENRS